MMKQHKPRPASFHSVPDTAFGNLGGQKISLCDLRLLKSSSAMAIGASIPTLDQSIAIQIAKKDSPPTIFASLSFSIVGNYEDGREGLRVEATFGLAYQVESHENVADEHVAAFCRQVALTHAWPYWREFVQSMIGRMGLPPLHIPLMQPGQMKAALKKNTPLAKKRRRSKRS
jgi:preprotein translocase subunit SecB